LSYLANTDKQTNKNRQKNNLLGGGNNKIMALANTPCAIQPIYITNTILV